MDGRQIQQVRRFNRVVTQRVGALEESYLRRGRPLGEARLIFETGVDGADLRALRDKLALDSGYLSRLLRSLETQGLVKVRKQAADARVKQAVLTAKGRSELRAYDKLSDELAETILSPLSAGERDRLVAAMAEVARLLTAASIELRAEPVDAVDAGWCLNEYFKELAERFEAGFDPGKGGVAEDDDMRPPGGVFLVARLDGRPIGCGGYKQLDETYGEIKRVWTAPSARGLGVARKIVRRLEETARESGLKALRLDTNKALKEAQAFYRREGYYEIARYSDNPYAHHWFEKKL
jgi:DNA-binding MarR family transcriptional regulator/GNAT superfamily N-acetyltransferase